MVVCLNIKWKLWNLQHLTLWSPSYQNSVTAGNKDPDQISERRKVNRERIYPTATFFSSNGGQRFHQLYSSLKRWLLWLDKGVKYLSWSEINPNLWQPGFFRMADHLKKYIEKLLHGQPVGHVTHECSPLVSCGHLVWCSAQRKDDKMIRFSSVDQETSWTELQELANVSSYLHPKKVWVYDYTGEVYTRNTQRINEPQLR